MIKSCIYQILNIINFKFYIGSSYDYDTRWFEHERKLRKDRHDNQHLQRAYNKYGADAFEFIVVELVDRKDISNREQFWIDTLNACDHAIGYNINPDASRPPYALGRIMSPETRLRISNATMGIKKSPYVKAPFTEQHKENIAIALRDFDTWPCEDGYNCKCNKCRYKRNRMKNYPNIRTTEVAK